MAIVDVGQAAREVVRLQAETATAGLTINLFWIIVAALNFLVFFAVLYLVVLKPIGVTLRRAPGPDRTGDPRRRPGPDRARGRRRQRRSPS